MNNNDIFLNVKWKVQLFKFECLLTLKPLNCNSYSGQKWYKSAWFSMIFFNWGSSEKGICLSVCLSVSNKRQKGRTDFVWNWKLTWPKGRFIKSQKLKVWSENNVDIYNFLERVNLYRKFREKFSFTFTKKWSFKEQQFDWF